MPALSLREKELGGGRGRKGTKEGGKEERMGMKGMSEDIELYKRFSPSPPRVCGT